MLHSAERLRLPGLRDNGFAGSDHSVKEFRTPMIRTASCRELSRLDAYLPILGIH